MSKILLIGTENCNRCLTTKNILTNKKVDFNYELLSALSEEEKEKYLNLAKKAKQVSFPLIVRDGELITLTEV